MSSVPLYRADRPKSEIYTPTQIHTNKWVHWGQKGASGSGAPSSRFARPIYGGSSTYHCRSQDYRKAVSLGSLTSSALPYTYIELHARSHLEVSFLVEQEVLGLEVAVAHALRVAVLHALDQLVEVVPRLVLREPAGQSEVATERLSLMSQVDSTGTARCRGISLGPV